jgi:cytoskeleton protein RodZ
MEKVVSIGELLSQAREKKKISLEEVANKTKININILRSLEADELESLPNKTYVKGFVQNYAKTIGLDVQDAAQALNDTYKAQEPEPEPVPEEEQAETKSAELTQEQLEIREKVINLIHNFFDKKTAITIVSLVVVILMIKGIVSFFTKVSNEQVKIKPETAQSDSNTIKSADKSLFDLKATEKLKKEAVAKEEAAKEAKEKEEAEKVAEKKEEVKKEETKKEEKPKVADRVDGKFPYKRFYPAPAKMYEVLPNAEENFNDELIPERIRESIVADKENVFIHAIEGDTWISYQADDDKIKRFVLKQGRHVLIRGDVILLFMGNANVSKVFYNNQLVSFNAKNGVKSLIFPSEEAKNYELPLFPSYKGVPYKAADYKANMAEESSEE